MGKEKEEVEEKRESKKYLERRVKCTLIFPNLDINSQKTNYQREQHVADTVNKYINL